MADGSARRITHPGGSTIFLFRGQAIHLISKTQPDAGATDIYFDGQKIMTLEQFQGPKD